MDNVSSLESVNLFGSREVESWEAELVGSGSAVGATACGLDGYRPGARARRATGHGAGEGRVQSMGFGNPKSGAVEFGFCTRGEGDWEASGLGHLNDPVSQDVHGRATVQRLFELGFYLFEFFRISEELVQRKVTFGLVARQAGDCEIRDSV